jgi:hypothetical protein
LSDGIDGDYPSSVQQTSRQLPTARLAPLPSLAFIGFQICCITLKFSGR